MPERAPERERPPPKRFLLSPWAGVAADSALTLLLVVLGIDPVFAVVEAFRTEAALAVCVSHLVVVTLGILTGAVRSEELDLLDARTRMGKVFEVAYFMFIVLGWMLPVAVAAVSRAIPKALFIACILAHVAPFVGILIVSLVGLAEQADRFVRWLVGRAGTRFLAFLFAVYLAGIEVFLLLLRSDRPSPAALALPIWVLSYLPTRLLLARLTGLKGPERYTFALSNAHLLLRLLLTSPD